MKHTLSILALGSLVACSGSQHPTVAQARAGLRIACAALAAAHAEGTDVPAPEIAALACDDERTSAIMRQLVERAKKLGEFVAAPPEWLDEPSLAGDAGAP